MSQAIVRIETPEEREYARYRTELEDRKRVTVELRAEIEALKAGLGRFESEYHARVGPLFIELDRLRLSVDAYESRIAALRVDPAADPEQVEREVGDAFAGRREEIGEQERENRGYEEVYAKEQERPQLAADAVGELQRLYRELARRHHPDLGRTEEERRRRVPLMQRVNTAMQQRDLAMLRTLLHELEVADEAFDARPIGEKLVWAIREVARLDAIVASLDAELRRLRAADSYVLWLRQEAGERVIEQLEVDLRRDIAREEARLAPLVSTYRRQVEERG